MSIPSKSDSTRSNLDQLHDMLNRWPSTVPPTSSYDYDSEHPGERHHKRNKILAIVTSTIIAVGTGIKIVIELMNAFK